MIEDRAAGCLLGTALGDAIGLPFEGLSRRRGTRLIGEPDRHRFLFGHGMVSDDTEHTCLVARSWLVSRGDLTHYERDLARRLRWWLLGMPAGVGLATLRATLRLCLGYAPSRSGVHSAGNGPAMRAPILGVVHEDLAELRAIVRVTSRVTHTDPRAEHGAWAVALAAHMAARSERVEPRAFLDQFTQLTEPCELTPLLANAVKAAESGLKPRAFAEEIGLSRGVGGFVCHTVPAAIHAWLTHQGNFRSAVTEMILCGGDTDTTAAIVGGLVGAGVGRAGLPQDWLQALWDWPRTVEWMEKLARACATRDAVEPVSPPPPLPAWGLLGRNLFFAGVVLMHGFRRLAPPY